LEEHSAETQEQPAVDSSQEKVPLEQRALAGHPDQQNLEEHQGDPFADTAMTAIGND